ncbi:MAG: hypothetical protein ABWK01_08855 [Infirmifilum sp.]
MVGISDIGASCTRILICSDLHCRSGRHCYQFKLIIEALLHLKGDCLVIAGDLFEDLHYHINNTRFIQELQKLGFPENPNFETVFTPSFSSHDPLLNEGSISVGSGNIHVRRVARINTGEEKIVVTHGDIILPNGAAAYLVNRIGNILGKKLLLEDKLKHKIGVRDEWFVMGHTHIPGLDPLRKLGNPGSWKFEWRGGVPYWRKPTRTFLFYNSKRFRLLRL